MRTVAAAAAAVLVAAAPGATASTKPRLTMSGHTFDRGRVLHVAGRDCRHSGAGVGYGFHMESGSYTFEFRGWTGGDIRPDGTWDADLPMRLAPGRYTLVAGCYERTEPTIYYPPETVTVVPQRSPVAERALTITPAVAHPGDTVRVSAPISSGWKGAPGVFLAATRAYLGSVSYATDAHSALTGTIRVPRSLAPGSHTLVVQADGDDGGDGFVTATGTLRVVASAPVAADEPTRAPTTAPTAPRPAAPPSPKPTPSPTTASPEATVEPSTEPPPPTATVAVRDAGDGLDAGRVAAAGGAAALALAGGTFVVRRRRRA